MPSGPPLFTVQVSLYIKSNWWGEREGVGNRPACSDFNNWVVSTLALSAISLAKNVSFPKQEVKRKHLCFLAGITALV